MYANENTIYPLKPLKPWTVHPSQSRSRETDCCFGMFGILLVNNLAIALNHRSNQDLIVGEP